MRTTLLVTAVFAVPGLVTACSNDPGVQRDIGLSADARLTDRGNTAKADGPTKDAPAAKNDGSQDQVVGQGTVKGMVKAGGSVTCGSTPAADCKGLIYVGAKDSPNPTGNSVGIMAVLDADLSGGKTVPYTLRVPAMKLYVGGQLNEDGSSGDAKPGDLLIPDPVELTVQTGQTVTQDIVLERYPGP